MSTAVHPQVTPMTQPDASALFHRTVAHTQREAETYAPAFAPPLGALPVTPPATSGAPRTAWVDGGTYHLIDWRDVAKRGEDLRAEGREVTLRYAGRGRVTLQYTTTTYPDRFHAAEGAECGGEADAAHDSAVAHGGA